MHKQELSFSDLTKRLCKLRDDVRASEVSNAGVSPDAAQEALWEECIASLRSSATTATTHLAEADIEIHVGAVNFPQKQMKDHILSFSVRPAFLEEAWVRFVASEEGCIDITYQRDDGIYESIDRRQMEKFTESDGREIIFKLLIDAIDHSRPSTSPA